MGEPARRPGSIGTERPRRRATLGATLLFSAGVLMVLAALIAVGVVGTPEETRVTIATVLFLAGLADLLVGIRFRRRPS